MNSIAQQLEHLQRYLQVIEEQLQETENAIINIDELSAIDEAEAYVPMTSGIYIKAKITDTKQFLLNVGNELVTAHSAKEAKQMLTEQLEELQSAQAQLSEQFAQAYQHYISMHLQAQEGQ